MASRSVNKVILLGHLGKDAETKFTPSGVAVTKATLATSRRWKDQQSGEWKEETEWHNITMWRMEGVSTYLTKGKQVYVEGRLKTHSYEDKDGQKKYMTEVVADEVILVGGGGAAGGRGDDGGFGEAPPPRQSYGGGAAGTNMVSMPRSSRPPAAAPQSQAPSPFDQGITDDDVPF